MSLWTKKSLVAIVAIPMLTTGATDTVIGVCVALAARPQGLFDEW